MTIPSNDQGMVHPGDYHAAALSLRAKATPRPHGALRYRCPVNHSFICVTDDATLAALDQPDARLRCPSCGDVHRLT